MIKKILIISFVVATLTIGIKQVNAAFIQDNSNTVNRELSCDKTNSTITRFNQPSAVVYSSNFCEIKCTEDVTLVFDAIRSVYSGGGFAYPLNMSAKKTCVVANKNEVNIGGKLINQNDNLVSLIVLYNFLEDFSKNDTYNADMNGDGIINYRDLQDLNYVIGNYTSIRKGFEGRKLLDLNNDNTIDGFSIDTLRAEILYIKDEKQKCSSYGDTAETEYKVEPDASLEITKDDNSKVIEALSFVPSDDSSPKYDRNVSFELDNYLECTIGEVKQGNANLFTCVYDYGIKSWNKSYLIMGRYTMGDKKISQPSGYVIDIDQAVKGKYCVSKERYYTNIKTITKPIPGEEAIDNGYPMTLYFNDFGHNLNPGVKPANPWSLKVNCWYQVKNVFSPKEIDYWYNDYKNTSSKVDFENDFAIVYRPIDLENPFPTERGIGSNWLGNYYTYENGKIVDSNTSLIVKHITSKGNEVKKEIMYRLDLTKDAILDIKRYNEINSYTRYDDNYNDISDFYEKYFGTVIKKTDSR